MANKDNRKQVLSIVEKICSNQGLNILDTINDSEFNENGFRSVEPDVSFKSNSILLKIGISDGEFNHSSFTVECFVFPKCKILDGYNGFSKDFMESFIYEMQKLQSKRKFILLSEDVYV